MSSRTFSTLQEFDIYSQKFRSRLDYYEQTCRNLLAIYPEAILFDLPTYLENCDENDCSLLFKSQFDFAFFDFDFAGQENNKTIYLYEKFVFQDGTKASGMRKHLAMFKDGYLWMDEKVLEPIVVYGRQKAFKEKFLPLFDNCTKIQVYNGRVENSKNMI